MNIIPMKIVDTVWIQAEQKTLVEINKQIKQYMQNQQQLYAFLVKFTDHLNSEIIEIAFSYASIILEIYLTAYQKTINEIPQDIINTCLDKRDDWLENINGFDYQHFDELINTDRTIKQKNILRHALDALFEEGEDNLELNSEDQSYLFWVLIIIIDSLDTVTSQF